MISNVGRRHRVLSIIFVLVYLRVIRPKTFSPASVFECSFARQRQNGKKTNTVENTQIQSKIHKYKDKIQNCLKTIFFRCAMKFQHFRICICSYFPLIVIIVVNFCSHIVKFDFGLGNNILEFAPSFVLFRQIILCF